MLLKTTQNTIKHERYDSNTSWILVLPVTHQQHGYTEGDPQHNDHVALHQGDDLRRTRLQPNTESRVALPGQSLWRLCANSPCCNNRCSRSLLTLHCSYTRLEPGSSPWGRLGVRNIGAAQESRQLHQRACYSSCWGLNYFSCLTTIC